MLHAPLPGSRCLSTTVRACSALLGQLVSGPLQLEEKLLEQMLQQARAAEGEERGAGGGAGDKEPADEEFEDI